MHEANGVGSKVEQRDVFSHKSGRERAQPTTPMWQPGGVVMRRVSVSVLPMADLLEDLEKHAWLAPWAPVTPVAAERHGQWLARLPDDHPLQRGRARAVAARSDDVADVLFVLADPPRLAVVNLRDPSAVSDFASVTEFDEAVMQPDHLEHSDDDI